MRLYVGKITVERRGATLHISPDSSNVIAFWLCIPWASDKLTLDLSLGHHIVVQEHQDYFSNEQWKVNVNLWGSSAKHAKPCILIIC